MINSSKKENLILSVGRFDSDLHSKRHDVMIEAFKQMKLSKWELVLAGGAINAASVEKLRASIGSAHIRLMVNPRFEVMNNLYSTASIYWHAAGYGADLHLNPEKAEHFGISTVEAMSAGSIPIVFNGGGQTEIVSHGINGFLWNTVDDLKNLTKEVINLNSQQASQIRHQAQIRAKKFDAENFLHAFRETIS